MSMIHISARQLARGLFLGSIMMFMYAPHTEGLRGCSSFGHSCFGAHGKRTDGKDGLSPSTRPEIADVNYNNPMNSRFDMDIPDNRDYGTMDINGLPARGKTIPIALLKILRNLANNMGESSSEKK